MLQTAKQSLLYIIISTLLAAFSAGAIIIFADPAQAGFVTLAFLYVSLFLVVFGVFLLLGIFLRTKIFKGMYLVSLSESIRQSLLVSILIIASLALSSQGLLYWWVEGSLVLFLAFLEIFLNLKV